jgi:spore coat protein U-like protein
VRPTSRNFHQPSRAVRSAVPLAAVLLVLLAAAPAGAQTCAGVSTTPVDFGPYNARTGGGPVDGQGSVSVDCDAGTAFDVALDPGQSGGFSPRRMARTGGGYQLDYNLYLDAARVQVWGDGTGVTVTQSGVGAATPRNYTVYGRIPPLQNVGVGAYSDSVTVTVTY